MSKKNPNPDEQRAEEWLRLQGFTQIAFPSNDPPDFLVDGRFAVEVTRLQPPHETHDIPFERAVERVLESFGHPNKYPGVIFVTCDAPQPRLPDRRTLEQELKQALNCMLLQGSIASGERFFLNCGVDVSLWPSTQTCGLQFELSDSSTGASHGGFPSDLTENIARCICEKSKTVRNQNRENLYSEWWLILIDYIEFTASKTSTELQQLRQDIQIREFWNRIIVVGAEDQGSYYEL